MDQLLIALVGLEKSGKSRLATTGRKPILVFDWDGRSASLAGRKGVFAVSFTDQTGHLMPDAFASYLTIMTQLETNNFDLGCVSIDGKDFGVPQGTIVQTIVHDSIARLSRAVMRYMLANSAQSKGIAREINVGQLKVRFPGGFDAWNMEMTAIEDQLLRTFGSRKDVICVFHESAEEAPESSSDNPVYTGRIGIFPVRHQRLLGYFNEVWRVQRGQAIGNGSQDAVPFVQTAPDYTFKYAASALDIQSQEVPDIETMLAKHVSKHGGRMTPAPSAPVPTQVPKAMAEPTAQRVPRMITMATPVEEQKK